MTPFGPSALLDCYRRGVFPMSDSRTDNQVFLMDPDRRGIIPLDSLHVSRSLKKFMQRSTWEIAYNRDFPSVIHACALPKRGRESTWISKGLEQLYLELHTHSYAYSVEVYDSENLVGGLYGVKLGGAFFGESMFSVKTNASKVALVALVKVLNENGFSLLDTQFLTDHLKTLGGIEISRADYHKQLEYALSISTKFPNGCESVTNLI